MADKDGVVPPTGASKVKLQMQKMQEANAKYKNLLKLAKERIQQQEDELKRAKADLEAAKRQPENPDRDAFLGVDNTDVVGNSAEHSYNIVQVCQRVRMELGQHEQDIGNNCEEIWALVEFEMFDPDQQEPIAPPKRTRKWKRFNTETELQDFIRRDTGEPLQLPPYSLTPHQSSQLQEASKQSVAKITEEFRRFRVKSEMARKQADAQIRDLQSTNVESAKKRIEGHDVEKELEQARSEHSRLERMRVEMSQQEAQWKEAYDLLLAENKKLKSSGSEALLASQWRQRYEACLKEKDVLESKIRVEMEKAETADGKYEMKYRDLKESFRLYRKKAKEIFEAQQTGPQGNLQRTPFVHRGVSSNQDSKLDYLKNLMVNYLTSDMDVREHMEGAIGTVLQFTPEDIAKIEEKKAESDYWAYLGYG
eukprot:scaffold2243_cov122-Cylindrotheca_fusiformis.AAC.22